MQIPRVMLAAASSGSGKTITVCGLMAALKKQGDRVVSCKCGPDYIDPMFHREALGIESENLDLFFCDEQKNTELFIKHAKDADIAVIEGVMGYYDGMALDSDKASSYDVAKALKTPVILVVSARGAALSVLALIKGMVEFRKDSNIQGILLNKVSEMLYPRMKEVIEKGLQEMGHMIPVVGYIPQMEVFSLESRHLGLVTPEEISDIQDRIQRAGTVIEKTVDLDAIRHIASQAAELLLVHTDEKQAERVKIAIARDEAFCFYYKANLTLLEEMGCTLLPFSPLRDTQLPKGTQGMLIGGGYPELYAKKLAENRQMLLEIRKKITDGMPCLAECGGFMYLHEEMEDESKQSFQMAGVIKGKAFRTDRLVRFGYVNLSGRRDTKYLNEAEMIRGHEFHYWDSTQNGEDCLAVKPDGKRSWTCVHAEGNLFAGYPHIHFHSNINFAKRFVQAAEKWKR